MLAAMAIDILHPPRRSRPLPRGHDDRVRRRRRRGFRRRRAVAGPVAAGQAWAAFDAGHIVATAGTLDLTGDPGATLAMAGLTMVTVRPTHRRRGLSELIQLHLDDARRRGQFRSAACGRWRRRLRPVRLRRRRRLRRFGDSRSPRWPRSRPARGSSTRRVRRRGGRPRLAAGDLRAGDRRAGPGRCVRSECGGASGGSSRCRSCETVGACDATWSSGAARRGRSATWSIASAAPSTTAADGTPRWSSFIGVIRGPRPAVAARAEHGFCSRPRPGRTRRRRHAAVDRRRSGAGSGAIAPTTLWLRIEDVGAALAARRYAGDGELRLPSTTRPGRWWSRTAAAAARRPASRPSCGSIARRRLAAPAASPRLSWRAPSSSAATVRRWRAPTACSPGRWRRVFGETPPESQMALAAVDEQPLAGDVAGAARGEERHRLGHLARGAEPAQRGVAAGGVDLRCRQVSAGRRPGAGTCRPRRRRRRRCWRGCRGGPPRERRRAGAPRARPWARPTRCRRPGSARGRPS